MHFSNDIYYNNEYIKLYGEVFIFENVENGKYFKIIANKIPIKQTPYYDLQSTYGYSGIVCNTNDEEFIKISFDKFKQLAKKENIIAFFIRFHPFDSNIQIYEKYLNFCKCEKKVVIVELSQDYTKIKKQCQKKNKYAINQARKIINISRCDKRDNLKFYTLYKETMIRNNANEFYFFNEKYFEKLWSFDDYIAFKASLNCEEIAFASFFMGKDISYYHLSANTLKSNANAALLDYFFEYAGNKGLKYCVLGGGIKDDDNLFSFKQKFSKNYKYFYIGGIVINEQIYNYLCSQYNNPYFLKYRM
ncbi:hypothetical protein [Campylobacter peloridis]|uniref:hypothetical protein n=1 Tax=Campylobacter peloridis TaxID=488546 RepID=UPI001C731C0F|nr:hypothetical protein [Campylobacter peloridis]MBX1885949.1 hypothetical protein [Campylobacter peloridis]